MSKSKRNADKQAFWQRAIGEQRRRGLGVRAYCRREGLSEASFYWWRRRLAARTATSATSGGSGDAGQQSKPVPSSIPAPVSFVEVTSASCPAPAVAPAVESLLEVRLPGGAIVCVQAGFDATLLRQVVEALS